jgi:pimeloyl-ACP methyl ester carboxylesterase
MEALPPEGFAVGIGDQARDVAVIARAGGGPGLFWLGGFNSDMAGTKASAIDAFAKNRGIAFTRFDYSGHGQSGGRFEEGTISRWLEEAGAVFERFTAGRQIVIGSSMGGWIALLLAEAQRALAGSGESRIAGLVLIAPAVDMTRSLMWAAMKKPDRKRLMNEGSVLRPTEYGEKPYVITRALIEDGDRHLYGDRLIETGCPVHILQGKLDRDVPWRHAADLVSRLASDDVVLTLVKDGDHRLSRPQDLEQLTAAIGGLIAEIAT